MKKLIIILLALFIAATVGKAQMPQPIYSFAKVLYPISWYKEQQKLWKAEIDKNQKNAVAWYHYFRATRTIGKLDESDKRTQEEKEKALADVVTQMGKAIPNTTEYHHAEWIVNGFKDMGKLYHLQKAEELDPNNPFIFPDLINVAEMERDTTRLYTLSKHWFETGDPSPGFLNYTYNVMAGLKQNAILITVGDNDTYPAWVLQGAQGFRKDVTVINTSLILAKDYRDKLFKELGVAPITYNPFENFERFEKELVSLLASNTKNKPVYVALTAHKSLIEPHQQNLYLTGLAYEYCATTIDNMAALKKNFEHNYALDYLDKTFIADISAGLVKNLNTNYTVPMVKLYQHYIQAGETQKAEQIKTLALKIAENTSCEKEVKNYFKK